ncbi:MAG: glycosyltransferase family 4 protein [Anaerolineae bacterium]|nr:glycosyltransferase family 4 protein [Anaerolineae bacterium]
MPKVSFFVADLSLNPIVRAYPLARAVEKLGYRVEVLGFQSGATVYAPYKDTFEYKTLPYRRVMSNLRNLAGMATGDIIYGCKPLWESYGAALIASGFGRRKLLLFDVEDDELYFSYNGLGDFVKRHLVRGWISRSSLQWKLLLHPFTRLSAHTTVSSRKLQRRYGGDILLHGPDETVLDPERSDLSPAVCRQQLGLPQDVPLVLFAGTPHPHKGMRLIVDSLCDPANTDYHLALAGPADHPEFQYAAQALGRRCHVLGYLPYEDMPALLAAVDVVPTPQQQNRYTEAQIPAKLLEAMAMAKVIIASRVSDLADILGEHTSQPRGWVVPPGDTGALSDTFSQVLSSPDEARRRSQRARRYFLDHASVQANAEKLSRIIEQCVSQGNCTKWSAGL